MNTDDVSPLLGHTELCAALTDEERRIISELGTVETAEEGTLLMVEGEPGDAMLLLVEGEVAVQKSTRSGSSRMLARLGKGAILGEVSLLEPSPRTASVRTLSPVRYFSVPRARFLEELEAGSTAVAKLTVALARVLAQRMHALTVKVVELAERVEDDESGDDQGVHLMDSIIIQLET